MSNANQEHQRTGYCAETISCIREWIPVRAAGLLMMAQQTMKWWIPAPAPASKTRRSSAKMGIMWIGLQAMRPDASEVHAINAIAQIPTPRIQMATRLRINAKKRSAPMVLMTMMTGRLILRMMHAACANIAAMGYRTDAIGVSAPHFAKDAIFLLPSGNSDPARDVQALVLVNLTERTPKAALQIPAALNPAVS